MAAEKVVIAYGTNINPSWKKEPSKSTSGESAGNMAPRNKTTIKRSPFWDVDYRSFWVLDNDGVQMVDLPPEFYMNMPPDAQCLFSTNGGVYRKKCADLCQPRKVTLWLGLKVYQSACVIRSNFTSFMRDVKEPKNWTDLYQYFDSYDLWNNGVYNCWNVIKLIAEDNKSIEPLIREDKRTVVDQWIDQWMSAEGNPNILEGWTKGTDILLTLHKGDFGNGGVGQLDTEGLEMLREALVKRYNQHMLSKQQKQVRTWLGKRFVFPSHNTQGD